MKFSCLTFITATALAVSPLMQAAEKNCINIGNTPWRFTKIHNDQENLAKTGTVMIGTQQIDQLTDNKLDTHINASGKTINVDCRDSRTIEKFSVTFGADSIRSAKLHISASNDNVNWSNLADNKSITCQLNQENDITNVNNTFGAAVVTKSTSAVVNINAPFRYFKLQISDCRNDKGKAIVPEICELLITPKVKPLDVAHITSFDFDDSKWEQVGIPHCYNEFDTYLNATTGERCWRGETWYRKKMFFPKKDRNKKMYLQFFSVNLGTTVYINGHALLTNSQVPQPAEVTHVGSFLPFCVDITPYIVWGKDNQIAIRVGNGKNSFFAWPNFAENEGFGQAQGGIASKILLLKKHKVHIPENSYSPLNKWGTYFGTISADKSQATFRSLTNVENSSEEPQSVELVTKLIDKSGKTIYTKRQQSKVQSGETTLFDFTDSIQSPKLWFPIGTSGKPYLYTLQNIVYIKGKVVDIRTEKVGLRTLRWDNHYCYVNDEKVILRGFGNRNIYPGLGSAMPESLQWSDMRLIAECGGNTLRVGHQPPHHEMINAADELGIMLIVDSGDNEWALKNEPALTYKREYDRDCIIAFRNHPSVVVWESNNGLAYDGEKYYPIYTQEIVNNWDFIAPRIVSNRDGVPERWDNKYPLLISFTNGYYRSDEHPSMNAEVYGTNWNGNPSQCIARSDYDHEKQFSNWYAQNYCDDLKNNACGWIDWMLAETYGEGYTIYLNGMRNQKSLGSCAMDGNRLPKLKYHIYKNALWIPFSERPGVALQSHWNYSGIQDIDAWSNCPYVELKINGKSQGIIEPTGDTHRCTWKDISWEAGVVEAIGLDAEHNPVCRETIETSEEPYAIVLSVENAPLGSEGKPIALTANGSDALVVTAKIVDSKGRWCPRANNTLHFSIDGNASYKGSYDFYITPDKGLFYHNPGDPELNAEGGLRRIVARTTFTPGKITVKASSPGLKSGECTIYSQPVKN